MKCPLCDVPMRELNRRGVQIDVCPECKGVWLDRGELEKLLAVAEQEETAAYESRGSRRRDGDDDDRRRGSSFGSSGDSFGSSGDRTRGRSGSFFGGSGDSFGSSGDRTRGRSGSDSSDGRRGYVQQKKKKSWFSQMMETVGGEGED